MPLQGEDSEPERYKEGDDEAGIGGVFGDKCRMALLGVVVPCVSLSCGDVVDQEFGPFDVGPSVDMVLR